MPKKPAAVAKQPPPLELLKQFTPLVIKMAGGFQRKLPRNVLREDIIAAGMGGLWDAIRRHAGPLEASFEWYLRVRIRGAILDELRAQDWLPRRARARAEESIAAGNEAYFPPPAIVRFDELSEASQNQALHYASSSEAIIDTKERFESAYEALQILPQRSRYIVAQHYLHGRKFKDLGIELDVSEPRISQLHARAMEWLRAHLSGAPMPGSRKWALRERKPARKKPKTKVPQRGRKKKRRASPKKNAPRRVRKKNRK